MNEIGGTKEELIATVRTLKKNNEYESRIKANQISDLQQENKQQKELLDKIYQYCEEGKRINNKDNDTVCESMYIAYSEIQSLYPKEEGKQL